MQLRQQRGILLSNLVRLLCWTDELVGIECHALVRADGHDSLCLCPSRAAAMARNAHRATRTDIFHR